MNVLIDFGSFLHQHWDWTYFLCPRALLRACLAPSIRHRHTCLLSSALQQLPLSSVRSYSSSPVSWMGYSLSPLWPSPFLSWQVLSKTGGWWNHCIHLRIGYLPKLGEGLCKWALLMLLQHFMFSHSAFLIFHTAKHIHTHTCKQWTNIHRVNMHMHIHTQLFIYTYVNPQYRNMHTHMYIHIHIFYTCIYTHIYKKTDSFRNTYICTHIHVV